MELTYTAADEAFRDEIRTWLRDHGAAEVDDQDYAARLEWNRLMAREGWTCVHWPVEHGGRGLSLLQQVVFHEEYARAGAAHRVNHFGEELLGPTLIAFGSPEQKERFLPPIKAVEELWCQGYSEPNAGSDLAGIRTRARLDGDEWVIDGQKVWTSYAHQSDWIFLIARTEPGSERSRGLSFLLAPLDQDGVEVRPIRQLTGDANFNEVFFTGARTNADLVVGEAGDGWRVATALLGFERGVSTLGQQVGFEREFGVVLQRAKDNGSYDDPVVRDRLAASRAELEVMRLNALRGLVAATAGGDSSVGGGAASISKLVWARWHRALGELAMLVAGFDALPVGAPYVLDQAQWDMLYSRADTIYGGSDEVQRTILAERVLGLPREPRG